MELAVLWTANWVKCKNFWVPSMLQLTSLQQYKTQIVHLCLNQKFHTCNRVLLWKVRGFVSWVIILTKPQILKNAILNDICRSPNGIFSATTGLNSSTKISKKISYTCREGFDWKINDHTPGIKILTLQKFRKLFLKTIHLEHQNVVSP